MPTLTVDASTDIHYTDEGAGRPVVLLHGWPLSGASWKHQVPALLNEGFRVITYDRRGFGDSSRPVQGFDYDTLATDLKALLEALDLRDVTLVGFSMGGGEVARYLSSYGSERITSVVFASAVPPFLHRTEDNPEGPLDDAAIDAMDAELRADREEFFEGFTKTFFSTKALLGLTTHLRVDEEDRQEALALALRSGEEAALACQQAFARTDFRQDLLAVNVPTLVIHGDGDLIVPFEKSGALTHEAIPGSELRVIEGGPHGVNVSHAEEFTAELLAFLRRY